MNSDKYKDILTKHFIPTLSNGSSQEGPIFQQDLTPCHGSEKMQNFLSIREWICWIGLEILQTSTLLRIFRQ